MKTSATKDSVKEFISLLGNIEPNGLISGYKIDEETCYNVTPPGVAAETNMKIFKFSDSSCGGSGSAKVCNDDTLYPKFGSGTEKDGLCADSKRKRKF